MKSTYFSGYGNLRIAADTGGDPGSPAVILMHGGGQTRHSWGKAAYDLAEAGYYVISMDMRGHGESEWALGGDYSVDAFTGDVRAVAATLSAPPALVGASLGGATALIAAGDSGEFTASALVLVDVVPHMEKQGVARIKEFMGANADGFGSLEDVADAVSAYMPQRPRPSDYEGLMKNLRTGPNGRLYWHWDPAIQMNFNEDVDATRIQRMNAAAKKIKIPTLLVRGAASEVVSETGAKRLRELIPHAESVDVKGAGHMVAGDKNDAFNTAVIDFLRRQNRK